MGGGVAQVMLQGGGEAQVLQVLSLKDASVLTKAMVSRQPNDTYLKQLLPTRFHTLIKQCAYQT